jgi:hypothetical protein
VTECSPCLQPACSVFSTITVELFVLVPFQAQRVLRHQQSKKLWILHRPPLCHRALWPQWREWCNNLSSDGAFLQRPQ